MAYGQSMVTTLLIVVTLLNTMSFKLEARHDLTETTEPQLLNMYYWNYIPFPNMYDLNHQQPPHLAATTGDSPPSLHMIYPSYHHLIFPSPRHPRPYPEPLPSLPYPRRRVPHPGWPRRRWPPPQPDHRFYFERN
ncbi:hypothetical protein AAHE18_03G301000 [Arachis hypogaea]|nr:uncharacterized protein DS421_3g98560 [Arachis hypogaea]